MKFQGHKTGFRKGIIHFKTYLPHVSLFLAYLITAFVGLKFSAINSFAALIWPPSAIAFTLLAIFGLTYWPAVFLAALIVNIFVGASIPVAVGIATGNCLEAYLAVYWCSRENNFRLALDRFQDVSRFIIFAAILSTTASATIGATSLWLGNFIPPGQIQHTWLQWWAGDMLSDLTVAPLLFVSINEMRARKNRLQNPFRVVEALVFGFGTIFLSLSILNGMFNWQVSFVTGMKGIYLLVPLLLWAALRFGQKGAVFAEVTISGIAIYSTANGVGVFAREAFSANVLHLVTFVLVISVTGLLAGSVITERENQRTELEIGKRELKESKDASDTANLSKTEFLANMSHEIRTPLGVVLAFSELIIDPASTAEERKFFIETLKRNSQLVLNIIDDILDLSKVEAGKLQVEKAPIVLEELLSELIAMLKPKAAAKNLALGFSAENRIPKVIESDPLRLRQILLNVVGNAIKFTDRGSVNLLVKLVTPVDGKSILAFSVIDTGQGLTFEDSLKIFMPFTQADASTTRRFGGTGLGLTLSRKIAQQLGGSIELTQSSLGQGSTFLITIDPGAFRDQLPNANKPNISANSEFPLADLRVLLVDDSMDNKYFIERILTRKGANVLSASDGLEALSLGRDKENNFDVILMDLQMPNMDGYTATRKLRDVGYRKPIVALTAHAMTDQRQRCLEQGFDEHISKPIDQIRLIDLLANIKIEMQSV